MQQILKLGMLEKAVEGWVWVSKNSNAETHEGGLR